MRQGGAGAQEVQSRALSAVRACCPASVQPLQPRLLQLPGPALVTLHATLSARSLLPRPPAARLLYRERSKRAEGINFKALPLPPGRGGYVQQSQAAAWRTFLEWERSNPQRLEHAALVARCVLAWVDGCRGRCAGACLLHAMPATAAGPKGRRQ